MSLLVAIAASCSLTFKVREHGETLQQTGMDIEREYRAAELRIGDYAEDADDGKALCKLVERVESMRAEQARKERALDQPRVCSSRLHPVYRYRLMTTFSCVRPQLCNRVSTVHIDCHPVGHPTLSRLAR
jgi:hypothetical protein